MPQPRTTSRRSLLAVVAVVGVIAALVGATLVALAPLPSGTIRTHNLDLAYTAEVPPSVVYPEGRIGPVGAETLMADVWGDLVSRPLPRRLVERLAVDVTWDAEGLDAAAAAATATLHVRALSGWSQSSVLADATPLAPGESVRLDVPVADIAADVAEMAEVIDVPSDTFDLLVALDVDARGTAGGQPVLDAVTASLPITIGPDFLVVNGELVNSTTYGTNPPTGMAALQERVAERPLWALLGLVGLAAAGGAIGSLAAGVGLSSIEQQRRRAGRTAIDVDHDPVPGASAVRVADLVMARRIADQQALALFRQRVSPTTDRYVVSDGITTYETYVGPTPDDDCFDGSDLSDGHDLDQPSSGHDDGPFGRPAATQSPRRAVDDSADRSIAGTVRGAALGVVAVALSVAVTASAAGLMDTTTTGMTVQLTPPTAEELAVRP